MSIVRLRSLSARIRAPHVPHRQRGVVLFIALLVMVALSLAGIALIRSADTATIVAGNLAFKQAAASAVDRSIEQAVAALFDPAADPTLSNPVIADKKADLVAQNYFACVQADAGGCLPPDAPIPEIPDSLDHHDEIRRRRPQCRPGTCRRRQQQELLRDRAHVRQRRPRGREQLQSARPPGAWRRRGNAAFRGPRSRPGGAFYRVTVRVEGPRNTVAYAQAILQ